MYVYACVCVCSELPSAIHDSFQPILSASYDPELPTGVDSSWEAFRTAGCAATKTLPIAPSKPEADWMTDELLSLSKNKRDAWLQLRNADSDNIEAIKVKKPPKTEEVDQNWCRQGTQCLVE